MALTGEFVVTSSNLKFNLGVYGTVDPFIPSGTTTPAIQNNGARNPVGVIAFFPSPLAAGWTVGGGNVLATANGAGSGLWCKYVLYKSTANPATVGGPAPVYYTDETFTTVSGVNTEALGGGGASAGLNSIAGWLLPNTSTGQYGIGAGFTNTVLNNGGNGSYVWIGLAGFIPGAIAAASTAIGDAVIAAAGNFTTGRTAAGTAPTNKVLGWALSAVSGGLADVKADILPY